MIFSLLVSLFLSAARADFPPNDLSFPEDAPGISKVRKSSVDAAIKLIRERYKPIMKQRLGCRLRITNNWSDPTVNAAAWQENGYCNVEIFGGFPRHPKMTYGAVMSVLCHEVGHHLGGAPVYSDEKWASCEGQSDYWAQECMKAILGPTPARSAGLVLGEVLASFEGAPVPRYETPDPNRAWGIYCGHPRAQCRVDTYLAGIEGRKRPLCWYNP